jgi:hypothetical protein
MSRFEEVIIKDPTTSNQAGVNSDGQLHVVMRGKVDDNNSTTLPLLGDAIYIGTSTDTLDFAVMVITIETDQNSAIDGLCMQFSSDNINWYDGECYTIPANEAKTFSYQPETKYFRVRYTNGATGQGHLRLQTTLKKTYVKPSSHRIQDSISSDDDAELVKSVLTGLSDLTGLFENVKTYKGALQVDTALVHTQGVNQHIYRETGTSTTLSATASAGSTSITVNDPTGFVVGGDLLIKNTTKIEDHHLDIVNVSGSVITLNRPIDNSYDIGDNVISIDYDMNKSGSLASPISFKLPLLTNQRFQITRLIITMLDSTEMDDGKFGGISVLTNGVVVRTNINGVNRTLTHWQSNNDIRNDMYDVEYLPKAPAGQYALGGRWHLTRAEFIADIDGKTGDYIEVLIQDDLTGLDSFSIKAQGRIFGS